MMQKVAIKIEFKAGLCHAMTGNFSLSTQKERDGLCLSSAVSEIQWDSNPHCLYGY